MSDRTTSLETIDTSQKTGEQLRQEAIALDRQEAEPVVAELRSLGFKIDHIDDLYHRRLAYKSAIPILIKWLPIIRRNFTKESIVRALSVAWAKPTAAPTLISEFKIAPPRHVSSLKWAIGNALEAVADDSVFDEIAALARDRQHGTARGMLVTALGNMSNPRAADVLMELLDDDEVVGNALAALGKLGLESTRAVFERFLSHPEAWVRKEAKKALAKLDRKSVGKKPT